jgi:hypothetical protein
LKHSLLRTHPFFHPSVPAAPLAASISSALSISAGYDLSRIQRISEWRAQLHAARDRDLAAAEVSANQAEGAQAEAAAATQASAVVALAAAAESADPAPARAHCWALLASPGPFADARAASLERQAGSSDGGGRGSFGGGWREPSWRAQCRCPVSLLLTRRPLVAGGLGSDGAGGGAGLRTGAEASLEEAWWETLCALAEALLAARHPQRGSAFGAGLSGSGSSGSSGGGGSGAKLTAVDRAAAMEAAVATALKAANLDPRPVFVYLLDEVTGEPVLGDTRHSGNNRLSGSSCGPRWPLVLSATVASSGADAGPEREGNGGSGERAASLGALLPCGALGFRALLLAKGAAAAAATLGSHARGALAALASLDATPRRNGYGKDGRSSVAGFPRDAAPCDLARLEDFFARHDPVAPGGVGAAASGPRCGGLVRVAWPRLLANQGAADEAPGAAAKSSEARVPALDEPTDEPPPPRQARPLFAVGDEVGRDRLCVNRCVFFCGHTLTSCRRCCCARSSLCLNLKYHLLHLLLLLHRFQILLLLVLTSNILRQVMGLYAPEGVWYAATVEAVHEPLDDDPLGDLVGDADQRSSATASSSSSSSPRHPNGKRTYDIR